MVFWNAEIKAYLGAYGTSSLCDLVVQSQFGYFLVLDPP